MCITDVPYTILGRYNGCNFYSQGSDVILQRSHVPTYLSDRRSLKLDSGKFLVLLLAFVVGMPPPTIASISIDIFNGTLFIKKSQNDMWQYISLSTAKELLVILQKTQ